MSVAPPGTGSSDPAEGWADDPVGAVLAPCLELGEDEQAAAIASARREHPEYASEIDRRVALLRSMGLLQSGREAEPFPELLDHFRLIERLGGGGMGVVYRAVQEPLGREVALKLIRPELLYFPRARERFHREALAIASLQHPGIVPIYTVGDARGMPYFAMELVAGVTLAEVLATLQKRAPESLRGEDLQREVAAGALARRGEVPSEPPPAFRGNWVECGLRIAVQIARALEHAHARGVLHRDVKPSNIVLTPDGRARLIDFGLASTQLDSHITRTGSALGSLAYMAPEQVRGDQRIDARCDVYCLGVTLYEILTLQLPYSGTTSLITSSEILEGRPDSIGARNRLVPRDAETVCLSAMDREPAERYASARDFARDLENVLALRPIEARPPGAWIHARRWVQRNPWRASAAALGAALLFGAPTVLYLQQRANAAQLEDQARIAKAAEVKALEEKHSADQARARAEIDQRDGEQTAEFLLEVLGASDPNLARGREPTARDLLERGARRLEARADLKPEVRARLAERLGLSFANLGDYARARNLHEQALELYREARGAPDAASIKAEYQLARLFSMARWPGAEEMLRGTLEKQLALGEGGRRDALNTFNALANQRREVGQLDDALELCRQGLETALELSADTRHERAALLGTRAGTLLDSGRAAEAETVAREAIALYGEMAVDPFPGLLAARNTLAIAMVRLGRLDEAEEAYASLIEDSRAVHGERSERTACFRMNLASLRVRRGRLDEAEGLLREALAVYAEVLPEEHPDAVICRCHLGLVLYRQKRWEEARAALGGAVELERVRPADAPALPPWAHEYLGLASLALDDWAGGEEALREALRRHLEVSGEDDKAQVLRLSLALALTGFEEPPDEARELFDGFLTAAQERPALAPSVESALYGRGRVALARGEIGEAEGFLRGAWERGRAREPMTAYAFAGASALGECLARRGELAEARSLLEAGAKGLEATFGPGHAETRLAWSRLADFHEAAGRADEARAIRERLETERGY